MRRWRRTIWTWTLTEGNSDCGVGVIVPPSLFLVSSHSVWSDTTFFPCTSDDSIPQTRWLAGYEAKANWFDARDDFMISVFLLFLLSVQSA